MEKKLRSIHEGIIGWSCEAHPSKPFGHRLWFGLGSICGGPGDPIYHSKWLEERAREELFERRLAEFIDLNPEYKGREEEIIRIMERF